jgi:hypothetical protein
MAREDVWRIRDDRTLSWPAKLVWLMLESRGDDCRPSVAVLAADCGISKPTVRKARAELVGGGWLKESSAVSAAGDSDSNSYLVTTPRWGGKRPYPPPEEGASSQGGGQPQTPPVVNHADQGGQPQRPKEEKGSVKEKKPPTDSLRSSVPPKPKRGTRVPEDLIEQLRDKPGIVEWFRTECPRVDGRLQNEQFMDYWRAAPGQKGIKVDWVATWRRWMRTAQEDACGAQRQGRPNRLQHNHKARADYVAGLQEETTPERQAIEP